MKTNKPGQDSQTNVNTKLSPKHHEPQLPANMQGFMIKLTTENKKNKIIGYNSKLFFTSYLIFVVCFLCYLNSSSPASFHDYALMSEKKNVIDASDLQWNEQPKYTHENTIRNIQNCNKASERVHAKCVVGQ